MLINTDRQRDQKKDTENQPETIPDHQPVNMKPLALFAAIFLIAFYIFGSEEMEGFSTRSKIAQAPGTTLGIYDGTTKVSNKGDGSYVVHFRYQVGDATYRVNTTRTDEKGAREYAQQKQLIAYDTRTPAVATLKRYVDLNSKGSPTLGQVLFVVSVVSAGIALPLTLLGSWRLGWLRRRRGPARASRNASERS